MNAHEQWLQDRMTGIGGSDAAAVLGLSKYKTPLQVYQEKRGEIGPIPDNEPMLWGRVLEPVIRQQYAERTGRVVRLPEGIIRHPSLDFMLATVDGITDDDRLVEIKTARTAQDWGEAGTDEVPQAYLIQVQHYLTVTALPVADVAVLIGGSDFRLYHIEADRELQEMIIYGEAEFWKRVQQGEPPEPVTYADVQARFGRSSREGSVEASQAVLDAISALQRIKVAKAELEAQEELAKGVIMKAMGENDTLTHQGKVLATWKAQAGSKRFDSKTFQAHHPDLYSQFVAIGEPSRRFLLK
jgi:putative phage-type endonuclease